jgi:DNA-binding response OmpR family regulator
MNTEGIVADTLSASKKVLVVEDDWSILQLLDFHLKDAGYRTETAGTVGEAWRSILHDPPDAVLIDVHLPGAFGWELVERCRGDHRFHRLPIVMMSGRFDPEDCERARSLGAEIQLKPFNGPEPIEKLGGMMGQSQRVRLAASSVALFLSGYKVEGTIHLPPEHPRFSDGWAAILADQRHVIPVTNASILTFTDEVMSKAAFLQVSKAEIQLVVPLDDHEEKAI